MPSCVMRGCTNYSSKTTKNLGITYHAFPANELRAIKWIDIVRRQRRERDWRPNPSSRICSLHFYDADKYTTTKGLMMLKKTAVPVLMRGPSPPSSPGLQGSPNSLDGENIEDLESVFDSPQTAALKNCIQKINFEKQELTKKCKNLSKQNKRLRMKVASLKSILKDLKKS